MRLLFLAVGPLLTGCNAISTSMVLTAASSLPGAYAPIPVRSAGRELETAEPDEKAEADALADRVPEFMRASRDRAGPDATVTRTGYFSWEVTSPRVTTSCSVVGKHWRCDRELPATFSQQL